MSIYIICFFGGLIALLSVGRFWRDIDRAVAVKFPQVGEIYEAIEGFEIQTDSGRAVLPKGQRVRISESPNREPLFVYCHPIGDKAGNGFRIDSVDLNRCFRLVEVSRTSEETTKNAG